MQEQLISFETAKLAADKGFKIPVNNFYDMFTKELWKNHRKKTPTANYNVKDLSSKLWHKCGYSAPTQSLLQMWLREKHKIIIIIELVGNEQDYPKFIYSISTYYKSRIDLELQAISKNYEDIIKNSFNTYEEALEDGLFNALKLI